MPRGRPKKLSNYEKAKARKIRDCLSKQGIKRFGGMNDSSLLRTVQTDPSGRVYVSLDFCDAQVQKIKKVIADLGE